MPAWFKCVNTICQTIKYKYFNYNSIVFSVHTSLVANYFTDSNFRRKSYRQVSSKSIFSLLQTLAKIFLTKFERVSRKRENEGQCRRRRRRPEWPDAELNSSPNYSKSCPKVTHSRLTWKVALFTLAQKFIILLGYFDTTLTLKTFKNRPIWPHCTSLIFWMKNSFVVLPFAPRSWCHK